MKPAHSMLVLLTTIALVACSAGSTAAGPPDVETELDRRVSSFLESQRGRWRDMNVPESDGRLLYDLILEHEYTRALEIGTSTGHSAIWMALALSKTGGRLLTIEIDPGRHRQAVANLEAAGLSEFVEVRLADAHTLVPELEGPFDFVFCDADKGWYIKYLDAVLPKLTVGGCFTAHNVTSHGHGLAGFVKHLESLSELETTIDRSSSAGVSISFKRADGS